MSKHKLVPGRSLSFRTHATDRSGGTVDRIVVGMIPSADGGPAPPPVIEPVEVKGVSTSSTTGTPSTTGQA